MKKIATVSVLAIMAVSAARADIASTSYVDKAAAGAVTTGLGADGNITAAITTATNDMATKTKVAEDIAAAVTDMATQTWVTTTATAAQATADASGKVITATYATKEELNKVAGGELTIQKGAVGTDELADGSVTDAKLGADVKAAYVDTGELETALQPYANNTAGYQTSSDVSTAISTATTSGVIKQALDGKVDDSEIVGMAKTSDIHDNTLTITVNNKDAQTFTANAAADKTINIPVPTTVGELTNDANYQSADQVSTAISTATTSGVIKQALDGKVDDNEINDMATKTYVGEQLGSYSTTAQMNGELAKKQDKATAVTHAENTAVGDTTHAVYIDSTGAAQVVNKVASAAAADTATDYNATSGTIQAKFGAIDVTLNSLSDLDALTGYGKIPAPEECVNGQYECTLVMKYDTGAAGIVPVWEKIAR